jgi:hypothetical protein
VDFDDEEEDPIDEEEDEEKSETSSDYLAMQTASASNGKNKRGPGKKTEGRVAAKALISLVRSQPVVASCLLTVFCDYVYRARVSSRIPLYASNGHSMRRRRE